MTNVNITEGSGKVIATDTIGGVEYQKVEIYSGQVSVLGTVAVTQSGAWSASIYGTYTTPDNFVSGVTSVMVTTASVLALTAPGGTSRNYVTHIMATNGGAVGTYVNIVDGGQVIYAGYAAASGGGFSATLPTPLKQPTSVQALYAATTATSSVVVAMSGYKAV